MRAPIPTLKKTIFFILFSILAIFVICIVFVSPLTKYVVEKYDVKYTGRQIKLDWAYVNPFTGYIHFNNLKIYELNKDSVFFSAKGLSADFSMAKMISKTYEISELTLDQPWGIIIQKKKDFNFNDLIKKFTPPPADSSKAPVHFNILHIKIINGEFHYHEKVIPIKYFIKQVNIESMGKRWDTDTIASTFSFVSGTGKVQGNFTINTRNKNYCLATSIHDFDLEIIRQYLWELINYGMFTAHLDGSLKTSGNLNNPDSIDMQGRLVIKNFHIGKTTKEDYASFKKLVLVIDKLNPDNHQYLFDSITINHPFFKYERFDSLDNIQAMFGKKGSNISDVTKQPDRFNLVIEMARYIKTLSRKFFDSQYKINSLAIHEGNLKFNDYSLSEEFSLSANAIHIIADSIYKNNKRVNVSLQSAIKPYGNLAVDLSVSPRDSGYFDLGFRIQKVSASIFNPYLISYTSFPLDRGTLELTGNWHVRDGFIKSQNHLQVINPRVSERLRNKDTRWIPMPLIMSVIRERGNVIDYEIPITGNLKNPTFHLRDVLIHLVENILIKPPTIPYGMEVKNLEKNLDESLSLQWEMRQSSLQSHQEKFVKKMADFLKADTAASLVVHPKQYALKEKEYILFFEAKKKQFLLTHHKKQQQFSKDDSLEVDKMSVKNMAHYFVKNLRKSVRDTTMFTIQEKCHYFIGDDRVERKFNQLIRQRENAFRSYFIKNGTINRVKILASENDVPYNGFSYFKIKYKGAIPKSLLKMYEEMRELNQEEPRRKYFKDRPKISLFK